MRPAKLEAPGRCIDRLHVLDRIVGVEARWLDDLRLRKCRREMIRPEDELLDPVVPRGNGQQHRAYRRVIAHIAAGQKRQRAEADGTAEQIATIDIASPERRFPQGAVGGCLCSGRKIDGDGARTTIAISLNLRRRADGRCSPPFAVLDDRSAGHHCDERLRHQRARERTWTTRNRTIAVMQRKCTSRAVWKS